MNRPSRFRYFSDIVALAIAILGIEILFGRLYTPATLDAQLIYDLGSRMLAVLVACFLVRFRGETLAKISVRRPLNWAVAIAIGLGVAAFLFGAVYLSERAGFHRDLSFFKPMQGNLSLVLVGVGYSLGGAFHEEFIYRGFLFYGLAMFFGGGRAAWLTACLLQSVIFGAVHSYQNPLGILITGAFGFIAGLVYVACRRNLWPMIIAQIIYNVSRFVWFYFQGPPGA